MNLMSRLPVDPVLQAIPVVANSQSIGPYSTLNGIKIDGLGRVVVAG